MNGTGVHLNPSGLERRAKIAARIVSKIRLLLANAMDENAIESFAGHAVSLALSSLYAPSTHPVFRLARTDGFSGEVFVRCAKCGCLGLPDPIVGKICMECYEAVWDESKKREREFNDLLRQGVHPKMANRILMNKRGKFS